MRRLVDGRIPPLDRVDRPPHRLHQAERPGGHRARPAGADRAARALSRRPHHLGRQRRLRTAPARSPGPDGDAPVRPRRLPQGAVALRALCASVRSRTSPATFRPRPRLAGSVSQRSHVPGDRVPADESVSRRRAKVAATSIPIKLPRPTPRQMHAVDRNWMMAEALGVGDLPKRFHVPLDPVEIATVTAGTGRFAASMAGGGGRREMGDQALAARALRRVSCGEPRPTSVGRACSSARG